MKIRMSKIIAFFLSATIIITGFTNLSFIGRVVLAAETEESLGASASCDGCILGGLNGVPACVDSLGNLHVCENNFPDEKFREYLMNTLDINHDGGLSAYETNIVKIDIQGEWGKRGELCSLKGIEFFANLRILLCDSNSIEQLNLSNNRYLEELSCSDNFICKLNVDNCSNLVSIDCGFNQLSSLNVTNNKNLTILHCYFNQLTTLDIDNNTKLTQLFCYNNQLKDIDVKNNIELIQFCCNNNQLTDIDVSNNIKLELFYCYSNFLEYLNIDKNVNLIDLRCNNNQLAEINVSNNTELENLYCSNNLLNELDVKNNIHLMGLYCDNNFLKELNIINNTNLTLLQCMSNQLTELDLSNNKHLGSLSFNDQTTQLETYLEDNLWVANISELVSQSNFDRITSFSIGIFDSETGLITFDSKPTTFTYTYDVGKDDKTMTVTVNLIDHVHTFSDWQVRTKATCTDNGEEYRTCACGEEETREIAALGHSFTQYIYNKDASCTENGTETAKCDRCDVTDTRKVENSALGHDYSTDWVTDKEPTCAEPGSKSHHCTRCKGKTDITVIPATGNHTEDDGKWESDGINHWHTCFVCQITFDKAAHDGGEVTCSVKAVCSVCGAEYGEFDPDNHVNTEIRDAVAATEESEGYTGDTWCKDCGEKVKEGTVVPKLNHTHNMVKTEAKAATCEEDGNIEYYTCSKCGKNYNDEIGIHELTDAEIVIKATGHSFGTEWKSDADRHWHECACGERGDEEAHTFGDWTVTKAATETADGSRERECAACGYIQKETIGAAGGATDNTEPGEADEPGDSDSPLTGDSSNIFLWLALMAACGCGVIVATAAYKVRKVSQK